MDDMQDVANTNIFADVRYFLINSNSLEVESDLKANGAQEELYLSSYITHAICDDVDIPDYSEAKEVFELTIVKSSWVSKCLFANYLLPCEGFSPDPSLILSSVRAINLNLSEKTAKIIHSLLTYYGGQVYEEFNERCTHIFAEEYDQNAKKIEESEPGRAYNIVTPNWAIDCILENKLIDPITYNPKYLYNDQKNKELVDELEKIKIREENEAKEKEIQEAEAKEAEKILLNQEHIKKMEYIEIRKSIELQNPNVIKLTTSDMSKSPKTMTQNLVSEKKDNVYIGMTDNDEFKKLSASSIQSQLENTIRMNQYNARQNLQNVIMLNANPEINKEPSVTQDNNVQSEQHQSLSITPPKSKSCKKSQKLSTGISLNGTNLSDPLSASVTPNNSQYPNKNTNIQHIPQPQQVPPNNSLFDMDDIFNTVLSNSQKKDNQTNIVINMNDNVINNSEASLNITPQVNNLNQTDNHMEKLIANNNGVLPIYLNVIKPITEDTTTTVPLPSFDLESHGNQYTQENAQLIKFDRCLLGCVFFIKVSENYYTPDCLADWENVIYRFGGRVVHDYDQFRDDITHVLAPNRFSTIYKRALEDKKRTVTAYWLEDVLQEQKLRPPWLAYHFPSPYEIKDGPLSNYIITTHGFSGHEKLMLKTLIWLLNGKYASFLMDICSFLISKNSEGLKVDKAKKMDVKIVNGLWLMELYLGNTLALCEQVDERYTDLNVNHLGYDQSFVAEYLEQWKSLIKLPIERIKEANKDSELNSSLHRSPLKRRNRSDSLSPTNEIPMKKDLLQWQNRAHFSIPNVMFTGFNQNDLQQLQKIVTGLNGVISTQCAKISHLVVDKIERTAKLLKCMSTCEYVVHYKWILDSNNEGRFKDPREYIVYDQIFEAHYSCSIRESLARARTIRPVLSGLIFYLTPSVRPSYSDLDEMIKNAGGTVVRDIFNFNQLTEPFVDENQTGLTNKHVIIGSQNDLSFIKPFLEKKIPIYHEELVLSGLMQQRLKAVENFFHCDISN